MQARIQERTDLAHELHDSLAQTLASVRYYIRNLDHAIQGGDECEIFELLEVVESNVEIANTELRELIKRFRVPIDEDNLVHGIECAVGKLNDEVDAKVVFQNRLGEVEFPQSVVSQVMRIVQEALLNIKKYANANFVRVMMYMGDHQCHLLIEDDGMGFDEKSVANTDDGHFGLKTMSERASRIRGELTIDSAIHEGTRIHLVFPEL